MCVVVEQRERERERGGEDDNDAVVEDGNGGASESGDFLSPCL